MFKSTLWDVLPVFAWLALPYAGTSLVSATILLLAFRTTRRRAVARWLAYGFLALTGLLVACAFPMLRVVWEEHERHAAFDAATHHLMEPLKLGGIVFPAGSTVHVGEDGRADFGTLASPTLVEGVFLVGGFRLASDYGHDLPDIAEGTLARPADMHSIPCGPGALRSQAETTRCVLGRDYGFTGHVLAAGTMVEIYRSPRGAADAALRHARQAGAALGRALARGSNHRSGKQAAGLDGAWLRSGQPAPAGLPPVRPVRDHRGRHAARLSLLGHSAGSP